METKHCARCKTTKPVGEFFKNRARHDGLSGYCKVCQQAANSLHAQRQRQEVIDLLGGPVCARCEFDDIRALVVDHKDGGGSQHRRDAVSLWGVYRHALEHPEEYQVLCCNCNQIKRHEDGEWSSTEYIAKVRASPRETVTKPVRWARDFDACTDCETTETKHKSKGLCTNCYMTRWRAGTLDPVSPALAPAKG